MEGISCIVLALLKESYNASGSVEPLCTSRSTCGVKI